jgi:site-specific DNA recombinase
MAPDAPLLRRSLRTWRVGGSTWPPPSCKRGRLVHRGCSAARLNQEGLPSPRPRRDGRPRSWTSSSVRGILLNPLYRGRIVWGRIRKRDSWGLKKYLDRPESEWVKLDAEHLRIVPDELWHAAEHRLASTRMAHGWDAGRRAGGRPVRATDSRYLLTGFAECSVCGGGMVVGSQDFKRRGRRPVYGCGYHRERGNAVCTNRLVAPIEIADRSVLTALRADVMRLEVVDAAPEQALDTLRPSASEVTQRRRALEDELVDLERELARYARAVADVGPLASLLAEVQQREVRREHLTAQLQLVASAVTLAALDPAHVRRNLRERLTDWQGLLGRETAAARQILREVLVGRLIFTPRIDGTARYYEFTGQATLSGLLAGVVSPDMLVTPAGFARPWYVEVIRTVELVA